MNTLMLSQELAYEVPPLFSERWRIVERGNWFEVRYEPVGYPHLWKTVAAVDTYPEAVAYIQHQ